MNKSQISHTLLKWIFQYFNKQRLRFFIVCFLLGQIIAFVFIQSSSGQFDRVGRLKGRDFLVFYISGQIVRTGQAHRLYDQNFFIQQQKELTVLGGKNPPQLSLYPPIVGLLCAPLTRINYQNALFIWWLIQSLCFATAGYYLLLQSSPPLEWRAIAGLAIFAFYPVASTFWDGQLSGLWLLIFVIALNLHRKSMCLASGLIFSLLAFKPSLLAGVVIWFVMKFNIIAFSGLLIGVAIQILTVVFFLGYNVIFAYYQNIKLYNDLNKIVKFAAFHQHSLPWILIQKFGSKFTLTFKIIHLLMMVWAGWSLFIIDRDTSIRTQITNEKKTNANKSKLAWKDSALVIFVCIVTPYLLTYDLCLLLIPISWLWFANMGTNKIETALGLLMYFLSTLAPLYTLTGFSFVPLFLLISIEILKRLSISNGMCKAFYKC